MTDTKELIARLRQGALMSFSTNSGDGHYAMKEYVNPPPPIQTEAADELERLTRALADAERRANDDTVLNSYAAENQRLHDRALAAEAENKRLKEERDQPDRE